MYKFIVGTESKFTDALDASTQEAGEEYWHTLDKACLVLFLAVRMKKSIVKTQWNGLNCRKRLTRGQKKSNFMLHCFVV